MTSFSSALLPGLKFEIVNLTPELAKEYLEALPERQRVMSPRTVDRYAADMLADKFPFTGDPIRFNRNGDLIDGQHRCTAVIESGEPMAVLVIRGMEPDMIRFFDSGRTRRFADDLRIQGYSNHASLAAITARVWHWEHGNYGYMEVPYVANPLYANTSPSRAMLWTTLEQNLHLPEVATHAARIYRYTGNAPMSVTGLVWHLLGEVDPDAREKFFHELVSGSNQTGPEYPINVLRRTLTRRLNPTEERPGHVWLAYYMRAYNAWAGGETLSYLRMPSPARWNTWPLPQGMQRPGVQAPEDAE